MNEPSEEVKAMARRSAAKYWQTGDPSDEATARSILSGEWDDQAYTQAAIAAILETRTEIIRSLRHDFDDWPDYVALSDVADALEDGTHYGKAEQ